MAQKFYSPVDLFGVAGAEWKLQSGGNIKTARGLAEDLGPSGDIIATQSHTKQGTATCVYTSSAAAAGNHTWPKPGTVTATGWHIDSISATKEAANWLKLTVTGHKHEDGAGHAAGSCKTYTPSLVLPIRFGIARAIGGVLVLDDEADIGMRSFTYSVSTEHNDEFDGDGAHLAGQTRGGKETLVAEFTGEVDIEGELTIAEGWTLGPSGYDGESNSTAKTTSVTITHPLAADVPAP